MSKEDTPIVRKPEFADGRGYAVIAALLTAAVIGLAFVPVISAHRSNPVRLPTPAGLAQE